jgi:hypothetical protein
MPDPIAQSNCVGLLLPGLQATRDDEQGVAVQKCVVHRTRAPEKCVILMIENVRIIPTGN